MKELNHTEARIEMAKGEIVTDGESQWRWGMDGVEFRQSKHDEFQNGCWTGPEPDCGPYFIVKEPVKSLTFEEAIQAIKEGRTLQIQEPWENIPRNVETTRQPKRTTTLYLDLAERRGWPITLVEEKP